MPEAPTVAGAVVATDDVSPRSADLGETSLLWPRGTAASWRVDEGTWTDLALATLLPEAPGTNRGRLARAWRLVPTDEDTVRHRQDVWADLDRDDVADALAAFLADMDRSRSHLATAAKLRHPPQRAAWVLSAVTVYGRALHRLRDDLDRVAPRSSGLRSVRTHLVHHLASAPQRDRHEQAERLTAELARVTYVLRMTYGTVGVSPDADQDDAAAAVSATFARFRQSEPAARRRAGAPDGWLSHVEEAVIDRVAALHPRLFDELTAFAASCGAPFGPAVEQLDDEARTLLAYRSLVAPLRKAGLLVTLPELGPAGTLAARDTFDLALADRQIGDGRSVVTNDVHLGPDERVLVVTGPNQGGKTTLARTVGQLHLLGAQGLPVPGRDVRLAVPDLVVTQFERAEQVADRVSKLEQDLRRASALLDRCTDRSVALLNEVFSSTAASDAAVIGERLIRRLLDRHTVAVYVTFIDELSRLDPAVVSMMSTVDPDDPATRTYRVVRRPADGRAYAIALAARYGLTREQVLTKIGGRA